MLGVVFFYMFAVVVVAGALAMVFTKNLVRSAIYMAGTFLMISFLYILVGADYVAAVQILIYVGAISILFVFGIMLTKRDRMEDSNRLNRYGLAGTIVASLLFAGFAVSILKSSVKSKTPSLAVDSTIQTIAGLFLNDFALPFELAGVLLLSALLGAIVIGQGHRNAKSGDRGRNE